jgi:hypothetical protein
MRRRDRCVRPCRSLLGVSGERERERSGKAGGAAGHGAGKAGRTDGVFLSGGKSKMAFSEAGCVGIIGIDQVLLDGSGRHGGWSRKLRGELWMEG